MGSNHKPELTVYAPAAYSEAKDNVIPAYQEIPVSFLPQDPDLTDRKLHVKIEFTYTSGGKEVTETKYDSAQTDSGSVFSASYKNPLPAGGDLTVRIYAADKQGAWTEEIIPVKIREISANLQVSRSASGLLKDTLAERGKEFQLNYSIVPKPVQNQTGQAELMAITAPAFSEKLPPNLEVTALPDGISKSGTLAAGYTLSGSLPDIRYSADGSGKTYTAAPVNLQVTAKAMQTGSYVLSTAALSYRNIGQTALTSASFGTLSLESVAKLTQLSIPGATLAVGDTYKLIPSYQPADATISRLTWKSSDAGIVTVNEIGTIEGKSIGTAQITVTDSISGLSATAAVQVIKTGTKHQNTGRRQHVCARQPH